MRKRAFLLGISACLMVPLSLAAVLAAQEGESDEELYKFWELLVTAREQIKQNFYGAEVSDRQLFYDALHGMTSGLDPYSQFIPPEDFTQVEIDTSGEFGGLGMEITVDAETRMLIVVTPIEGTPAFRAGVEPGDVIVAIDGEETSGLTSTEAARKLRGPVGTKVTIRLFHPGETKPVDITLTREIIHVASIKGFMKDESGAWRYMLDEEAKIGYMRVVQFQENTVAEARDVLLDLVSKGLKGLVLDLRFNSGGLLGSSIEFSDLFLASGAIVSTRGKDPAQTHVYRSHRQGTLPDMPMAVLVNVATASGAEIVAGALQDNGRAVIVGERTFGKGLVQSLIPLGEDRASLKLTTAEYLTPSGRSIHRAGRRPLAVGEIEEPGAAPGVKAKEEQPSWGVQPDLGAPYTRDQILGLLAYRRQLDIVRKPQEPAEKAQEFHDTQLAMAVAAVKGALIYSKTGK